MRAWCVFIPTLCALGVVGIALGAEQVEPPEVQREQGARRPGVVRLVRGPLSTVAEGGEAMAEIAANQIGGFLGWVNLNNRLTKDAERLLLGQIQPEQLEARKGDTLDDVAVKCTLKNLPARLWVNSAGTNILFQRKRKALQVGNEVMEQNSERYRAWRESQIRGLEGSAQEIEVQEFLQAKGLLMSITGEEQPDASSSALNPSPIVMFTVTVTLDPGRRWNGERWEGWGNPSLEEFQFSVKRPKDPKREALFKETLHETRVIKGFGVEPVDPMIWPPLPLRELYPLLDLLSDEGDEAAFEALRKVAESGDAEAQFLLGRAYHRGEGTAADPAMAARWWEESAKQGYGPGLCAAAEVCLRAKGSSAEEERGVAYLKKAVALGNARAMALLGLRELAERRHDPPAGSGLARIQRAAAEGDPEALLFLSRAYFKGADVKRNPVRGEQLLEAAARRGHPPAMLELARFYLNRGERKKAWAWFYLTAKYNTTLSQQEHAEIKRDAAAAILRLRHELSETQDQIFKRDAAALEAVYRPLWTR